MRISDCGNYKIVFENSKYMMAHIMCLIPKGEFTKNLHTLHKGDEFKGFSFGYFWMSEGLTLQDFKRKVELCKNELQKHKETIERIGTDRSNWLTNHKDFEDHTKPMYLEYIAFIDSIDTL